jgi:hypothetical protein
MSQASHYQNIAFSTAFLTDKICLVLEGSYAASNYSTILGGFLYQYPIPHSIGRPMFCDALFSDDNINFIPNGNTTPDTTMSINLYSDASNIYILNTANTGTVYYKIVCTWIDNYDTSNPLVTPKFQTTSTQPYFDSRYNYLKIYKSDVLSMSTASSSQTVPQTLKSVPDFKLFFESLPGQVWPMINGGAQDGWLYDPTTQYECQGIMDRSKLTVSYASGTSSAATARVWYRIYYDN